MIAIESKRRKRENILKKYRDAVIADLAPPSHLRYDKKTGGVGEKKCASVARLADFF